MTLESATINSVNTVYAQLIQQLGAETVVETAQRMGMRCCPRVARAAAPRCCPTCRRCSARTRSTRWRCRRAYGTLATGGQHVIPVPVDQHRRRRRGASCGRPSPEPKQVRRARRSPSVADDILQKVVLYGTGTRRQHRPPADRQDRHRRHPHERLVRRSDPPAHRRRCGWASTRDRSRWNRLTTRITVFGGTWPAQIWRLFMLTAAAGLPVRELPDARTWATCRSRSTSRRTRTACRTPYTLPQNIQHPRVHRGHRADEGVHDPDLAPVRPGALGDRHGAGDAPRRRSRDAGFYVEVEVADSTQPAGHRDLADHPRRRRRRLPDEHRDDHGVEGRRRLRRRHGARPPPARRTGSLARRTATPGRAPR